MLERSVTTNVQCQFSSCTQTLFGGINLACMIKCKWLLKQINEKINSQMKE